VPGEGRLLLDLLVGAEVRLGGFALVCGTVARPCGGVLERVGGEPFQPLARTACIEPVRHVPLLGEVRQPDDRDARGDARETLSYLFSVVASRFVVVGEDDDVPAAKDLVVFRSPLSRSAGVRGRDQADRSEGLDVGLALDHADGDRGIGGEQLGQTVEDAGNAIEVVDEAAFAVGASLRKALRLVPHDLEQQGSLLVPIGVRRDEPPLTTAYGTSVRVTRDVPLPTVTLADEVVRIGAALGVRL